ncbi:MAG: hypothetical protein WD206_00910 [Actinomycetota bacterium]
MTFLRRVLYWEAVALALLGAALVIAPGVLFVDVLDQAPHPDGAWMRIGGVQAIGIALLMVLVGQNVEDRWWWAWAFCVVFAGTATISVFNAAFGVPDGASSLSWWLLGLIAVALAGMLLWAIGRAGIERPPDVQVGED